MNERPILFSAQMVRAILEGRKTQTRRIAKLMGDDGLQPDHSVWRFCEFHGDKAVWQHRTDIRRIITQTCPYGVGEDRLWVRENFQPLLADDLSRYKPNYKTGEGYKVSYVATAGVTEFYDMGTDSAFCTKITPSIFMPRWASRISLEVAEVRVQRLLEITESDAMAEGATPWEFGPEQCLTTGERGADSPYRSGFAYLWDCINADRATWKSNPWVWAVTFKGVA